MKWVKLLIIYSDIILGKRIDELEGSIGELMQEMDAGQEDASNPLKWLFLTNLVKGIGQEKKWRNFTLSLNMLWLIKFYPKL